MSERDRAVFESIAPGRVNLIGEHIDYNNLSVLPMAVDRDTRIRFHALDEALVRLSSPMAEFESREFPLGSPIEPAPAGDWSNYVRAAAQGLQQAGCALTRGFEGHVRGNIPVAAGMSSSSALVVASANALLHANDIPMPPLELAELMAQAERYVGVAGGGMDQAASVNGRAGHALRIDFAPLGFEAIPMPEDWCWVVASSMLRAEKSAGLKQEYNQRTQDCQRALQALWSLARPSLTGREPSYRELLSSEQGATQPAAQAQLLELAATTLDANLLARFRHVVTEAGRVQQAQAALRTDDPRAFGALMNQSHESLRSDYQVSIPELDELVGLATANGAHGARLTGAGFGGCVIALCPPARLEGLLAALEVAYYAPRGVDSAQDPAALAKVLFQVKAADGARVLPAE